MKRSIFVLGIALLLSACGGTDDLGTTDDELTTNEKIAYHFFKNKGLTGQQAAGIVGNLVQESSVNPNAKEFPSGPGRGIAQWSVGGRWDTDHHDNMEWYASAHGVSKWSLEAQLDFVWYELHDVGGYGLSALKGASTINEATVVFEKDFEGCGTCDQSQRIAYAHQVYNAFH